MLVEIVKLTARFKVDLTDVEEAVISEIYRLFKEYRRIVNELIEFAASKHIMSFVELYHAKYRELRQRFPMLPSHYIFAACRYAASICKSFIELKRLGMCEKEISLTSTATTLALVLSSGNITIWEKLTFK